MIREVASDDLINVKILAKLMLTAKINIFVLKFYFGTMMSFLLMIAYFESFTGELLFLS